MPRRAPEHEEGSRISYFPFPLGKRRIQVSELPRILCLFVALVRGKKKKGRKKGLSARVA